MMFHERTLITAPTREPVSLDEAKAWLLVEHTDDDALIDVLIKAARQHVENFTWRALNTQTWDIKLDLFDHDEIVIPFGALQSITHVKYIDVDGVEQTLSTSVYDVDTISDPGIVRLAYNQTWPSTRDHDQVITIRAVVGYGDTWGAIPEPIRLAIQGLITHWYESRNPVHVGSTPAEVPIFIDALLTPYRLVRFQ